MQRAGMSRALSILVPALGLAAGCGSSAIETAGAGGTGGAPVRAPSASAEARSVMERLRAAKLDAAATAEIVARGDAWIATRALAKPSGSQKAAKVELAASGGAFRVEAVDAAMAIHVRPDGAHGAAEVVDGHVIYAGRDRAAAHRVGVEGTEDFVVFAKAPARERLDYEVALERGVAGLRLVEGVLELLDAGGAPRLRMAKPYVVGADGARRDARVEVEGCAYDADPRGPWGREVTPPGAERCTVRVAWEGVRYPAVVDPAWTTTGNMITGRAAFPLVTLADGRALAAGGTDGNYKSEAELYDPSTGTWAATGSMQNALGNFPAVRLASDKVLAVGGQDGTTYATRAELYDPANGTWSPTGSMATGRASHTASLLATGKVLVVAGFSQSSAVGSAELYDPANGTFAPTGSLSQARQRHTATTLTDGNVLVAGGDLTGAAALSSAELYDPAAGTWTPVGSMSRPRSGHAAALLGTGMVLVAGGSTTGMTYQSAELYDPASKTWTTTAGMAAQRDAPTLTVLPQGSVLVAGGPGNAVEVYDVGTATWLQASDSNTLMAGQSATLLLSGKVLLAGGVLVKQAAKLFALEGVGVACSYPGECSSFHCADYVCCDAACDGACDVCSKTLGAPADGTCTVAAGYYGDPPCKAYVCGSAGAACPTSCTSDAACAPGYYCDSTGQCVMQKNQGAACDVTADCKAPGCRVCMMGHCADGVCCDAPCDGACDVCTKALGAQADGQCVVLAGSPGSPSCSPYLCVDKAAACPSTCGDDSACVAGTYCDSTGHCVSQKIKGAACDAVADCSDKSGGCRVCATGHCADGVCCDAACDKACDVCTAAFGATADGTCTAAPTTYAGCAGGSLLCTGQSADCPAGCTADTGCAAGFYCDNSGACQPRKAQGAACDLTANCKVAGCRACVTDHCVDGTCCDTACDGACDGCEANTGTCKLEVSGAPGNPACGGGYACDGTSPDCPTTCLADAACPPSAYCAGDGTCQPRKVLGAACALAVDCTSASCRECASNHCAGGLCCDADCSDPGLYCSAAGACLARKAQGQPCGATVECLAGACVDGVCCESSCDGQCERCDVTPGTCTPTAAGDAPHGNRAPCTGTGTACAGRCDGTNTNLCHYPGTTTTCGAKTCADGKESQDVCDGAGACQTPAAKACAPYRCGDDACKTSCETDADCSTGNACAADKTCAPAGSSCLDDHTAADAKGKTTDCTPYRCAGGKCKTECESVEDCLAPKVCDGSSHTCVEPVASEPADGAACGCRLPGVPADGRAAWAVAIALGLAARRRRARALSR